MLIIPHLGSLYKVTLDMKRPGKFNESLPKLLTVLSLIIWPVGTCIKLNIYIYIYIHTYTHTHTHMYIRTFWSYCSHFSLCIRHGGLLLRYVSEDIEIA